MNNNRKPQKRVAPFEKGNWVTPIDPTHPMFNHVGVVQSVEYVGYGVKNRYIVAVCFKQDPKNFNSVDFSSNLLRSVSGEVAASSRRAEESC